MKKARKLFYHRLLRFAPYDRIRYFLHSHQENSKLLIFYLICLNPLNLKLSKIREEKRRGLDLFFLLGLPINVLGMLSARQSLSGR